ncbi:hypothetical protein ACRDNQ_16260 [Palleronia sp. KMU-117]|uniref:hypothetical protein n=1 Tax=Palleronia sp. KMU-117 TaxID=3434108 RepID=UPI003D7559C6
MGPTLLHILITSGAIGLGIWLFNHPLILKGRSQLLRGVVIWAALVILLRVIDLAFLS